MRDYGIGSSYPEIVRQDDEETGCGGRFCSPECICDFCGEGIYAGQPALRVVSTRDIIHTSCWEDYSQDNMTYLTEVYKTDGGDE